MSTRNVPVSDHHHLGNPSNPSWISLINLPEDGWPVSNLDYDNKMPNQTLTTLFCRRIIEPSEGLPANQTNLLCIYNNNKQVGRLLLLLLLKIPAAAAGSDNSSGDGGSNSRPYKLRHTKLNLYILNVIGVLVSYKAGYGNLCVG